MFWQEVYINNKNSTTASFIEIENFFNQDRGYVINNYTRAIVLKNGNQG